MTYCPSCMSEIEDNIALCPNCGGKVNMDNQPHQLPALTILRGRYLIGRVLGEGGFGITYIGRDLSLDATVAVKEFFPSGFVGRYSGVSVVATTEAETLFEKGRSAFLDEAKCVHKFSGDPHIVNVADVFCENNTAYMVMEYIDGMTLTEFIRKYGAFKVFDELYEKLRPVMLSLAKVHETGLIHRDISPSNLMIDKSFSVKLLDFGTARNMSEGGEKSLSVVLKHGFSPPEQYTSHGKQGAWTDVYAMCATMYKLLTGKTPESAPDRGFASVDLKSPSQFGVKINETQEKVLKDGMALSIEQRISSMKELISRFDTAKKKPAPEPSSEPEPKPEPKPEPNRPKADMPGDGSKKKMRRAGGAFLAMLALVLAFVIYAAFSAPSGTDKVPGQTLWMTFPDAVNAAPGAAFLQPEKLAGSFNGNYHNGFEIFELDQPLVNCFQVDVSLKMIEYTGNPFRTWLLFAQDQDGKWTKIGSFVLDKEKKDDFQSFTIKLAQPMTVTAFEFNPDGGASSNTFDAYYSNAVCK